LTPVTLELGGKSPAIIGREADIDKAASKIMFGKCLNAGQTCIAPDYVLLPRGKEAAFIAAAKLIIEKQYPAIATNPDYSAIINQRHMTRLKSYLDEAREGGAIVTSLANCDLSTQKIAPTIVTNAKAASSLMCEEIFGPLLPLVTYDNIDEAIDYVNARARPLALYYFGHDRNEQESILNRTVAGGVSVNETIMHVSQEALPFGGVGPSGMGAYHGKYGFDTFSKLKPIFHQSRFNSLFLLKPPYGKRIDALLKILMK
jgi:acyl-CoA reductase-like NAD-dependent aldehyde dehydrogenase